MYEKGLNSRDHCYTYNAHVGSVKALIVSCDVINSRRTNFRHYGVTYAQEGVLGFGLNIGSDSATAVGLRVQACIGLNPFSQKCGSQDRHLGMSHNTRLTCVLVTYDEWDAGWMGCPQCVSFRYYVKLYLSIANTMYCFNGKQLYRLVIIINISDKLSLKKF